MEHTCRYQTVKRGADVHSMSPTTVRRALAEVVALQDAHTAEAPIRMLGIDEFSLRKGHCYATGLHDQIDVVSMDLAGNCRAAFQEILPQAVIVAVKFHAINRVIEVLCQVWHPMVRGNERADPPALDETEVLTGHENLMAAQHAKLALLLPAPAFPLSPNPCFSAVTRVVIRTGDCTPYSNMILRSGSPCG